jgi:hypothetical protein
VGAVETRQMASMPGVVALALTSLQSSDIGVRKAGCDAVAALAVSPDNTKSMGAGVCELVLSFIKTSTDEAASQCSGLAALAILVRGHADNQQINLLFPLFPFPSTLLFAYI